MAIIGALSELPTLVVVAEVVYAPVVTGFCCASSWRTDLARVDIFSADARMSRKFGELTSLPLLLSRAFLLAAASDCVSVSEERMDKSGAVRPLGVDC